MGYTILAADDEIELLNVMRLYFEKENLDFIIAKNGKEALEMFHQYHPDLVLLDVMMPNLNGYEVLKCIRKESKIPAIMLTARIQDYDKILGLEMGADDYITKPYNPLEVIARVKAQLRRAYDYVDVKTKTRHEIMMHGVRLKLDEGTVNCNGKEVVLTGIEIHILELLMSNPGRIFTKKQIFNQVWNDAYIGDDNTIMVHMSNLRKKLEEEPGNPQLIKTVKGLGYKFEKEKVSVK